MPRAAAIAASRDSSTTLQGKDWNAAALKDRSFTEVTASVARDFAGVMCHQPQANAGNITSKAVHATRNAPVPLSLVDDQILHALSELARDSGQLILQNLLMEPVILLYVNLVQ